MKIKTRATFFITICFLFSSCNIVQTDENNIKEITQTFIVDNKDFTYEADNVQLFDVGDDGTLCFLWQDLENVKTMLTVKDLNDNEVFTTEAGQLEVISSMTTKNNILYYTPDLYVDKAVIYSIDLNTGDKQETCIIDNLKDIKNIEVINDNIYFIGKDETLSNKFYDVYDFSDEFIYNGEVIGSYNLKNKKINYIPIIDLPITFTENGNNNLLFYAYDKNGGYYFQEYDTSSNSLGDKTYNNSLKILNYFTADETGKSIIYNSNANIDMLDLNYNSTTELSKDVKYTLNKGVIYKSGYLFYNMDKGIKRINLNELIRSSVSLNIALVDDFTLPEITGYKTNYVKMNTDEFVLSILAGDRENDIYYINSNHSYSDNIRLKGAFYPLTDVPGVKEYMDSAFPYIKEAATDKYDDIWMLPLRLSTLIIEYNERVWEKNNLDTDVLKTIEDIVDFLYYVKDNKIDETYLMPGNILAEKYFYQLIKKNNGFNRDDFKNMAEYFYNTVNYIKKPDELFSNSLFYNKSTKTDFDSTTGGLLFPMHTYFFERIEMVAKGEDFAYYEGVEDDLFTGKIDYFNYLSYRHVAFPNIKNIDVNDLTCYFICINPNSKNLNIALEYVSELSKYKINEKNNFILEDKSNYDDRIYINDLYNIFSDNNYIRFGLSTELFFEDFYKYLSDEITLDEYLNRIEFKINAYLNE